MDNIREIYRAKRLKSRIKLIEIANILGCTKGLISNWENARSSMVEEKVIAYMEYIDSKESVGETICHHV
ncbi:hypothetical protein BK127_26710 [Paenibacillus sp. FSL H7-0331]|nr:hypothetical protein BK127_26710 [Paenibacillus sp. FSL H7-0331]